METFILFCHLYTYHELIIEENALDMQLLVSEKARYLTIESFSNVIVKMILKNKSKKRNQMIPPNQSF